jgi:hypothetical protein
VEAADNADEPPEGLPIKGKPTPKTPQKRPVKPTGSELE